jgi:phosphatidylserine/phosphatidylglycerophosphate/cardiolipin synthase-like enzyme
VFFIAFLTACSTIDRVPSGFDKDTVFVEPDSGRKPFIDAIRSARKNIHIFSYKLVDPIIIKELQNAHQRGVNISIIVEPFIYKHGLEETKDIVSPIDQLKKFASVYTRSARFNQTHLKIFIIDESWAVFTTGNIVEYAFDNVNAERNFVVPILDKDSIKEIMRVFRADSQDKLIVPSHRQVVFGPDYQRTTFLRLLNQAEKTIDIYQQDFSDIEIARAVAGAAKEGVKVRLLMSPCGISEKIDQSIPAQNLIKKEGGKVKLSEKVQIHAKVIIVDGKEMYVGSCNFYPPSIDGTREMGVLIKNPKQIKIVQDRFNADWAKSVDDSKWRKHSTRDSLFWIKH